MLARLQGWLFPRGDIRWFAALLSVVMSVIILSHRQPVNNDGLLYLHVAEAFIQHGFAAAQQLYNWNFYPILIAYTSALTHLPLLYAALLLNTFLITWLVVMFITLIKELGGEGKVLYFATILIILFPYLNHDRGHIIRDFGYWAFYLTAIVMLLRFAKLPRWRYVLGWIMAMGTATLFRIEGGVIFALAPFALLLQPDWSIWQRIKYFLQAQIGFIVGAVAALALFLQTGDSLGRLRDLGVQVYFGMTLLTDNFVTQKTVFANTVLNIYSDDYAGIMLVGALVTLGLFVFINTLSAFFTLISAYGLAKIKLPCDTGSKRILVFLILLNLVIIVGFMGQHFFIVDRYTVALGLIILLWAPFALERLTLWPRLRYVIWAFVVIAAIDSIFHFGPSKTYIVDAGQWLRQQTSVTTKVYSNNRKIIFYAHRQGNPFNKGSLVPQEAVSPALWGKYDIIVLRVKKRQPDMEAHFRDIFKREPDKIFTAKNADGKVLLYRHPNVKP